MQVQSPRKSSVLDQLSNDALGVAQNLWQKLWDCGYKQDLRFKFKSLSLEITWARN